MRRTRHAGESQPDRPDIGYWANHAVEKDEGAGAFERGLQNDRRAKLRDRLKTHHQPPPLHGEGRDTKTPRKTLKSFVSPAPCTGGGALWFRAIAFHQDAHAGSACTVLRTARHTCDPAAGSRRSVLSLPWDRPPTSAKWASFIQMRLPYLVVNKGETFQSRTVLNSLMFQNGK